LEEVHGPESSEDEMGLRGILLAADDESTLEKLQRESGIPLPAWLLTTLSVVVLVAGVVAILKPLWPVLKGLWQNLAKMVARARQDQTRADRRGRFADYIEGQMRRLGEKEEWRDNRYAELEAEVEVRPRSRRGLFFWKPSAEDVRRLPSLSDALASVTDRVVLLEGDPGAGKSVALRHLTQAKAETVMRKPTEREPIPLYVNLKEFHAGSSVTAVDVRDLVFESVNRGRNRDIDRYLEEEFDRGVEEGAWIFLFDSFDEIPAVLSATDASPVIEEYADAIYEFLHGLGACRGVVASREFRGPARQLNWPRFKVMPLSWNRKVELIKKSDLPAVKEQELIEDLRTASVEMVSLSDNPMFLGLLCEHIRDGNSFPENAHSVIETYVSERFERDRDRIADIFAVDPGMVRAVAEELSFQIASHQAFGLSVGRDEATALVKDRVGLSEDEVLACLDALEYTKLARSVDEATSLAGERRITFGHRRLQEYFATCTVLREPARVSSTSLLTDGRWRETAVTVLQVQNTADTRNLLECAADLLKGYTESAVSKRGEAEEDFEWGTDQYHVLHVLSDGGGFGKYADEVEDLPKRVDVLLEAAWRTRNLMYRKWVLEVCAAASPDVALSFVRQAFRGSSPWLREEAYSQVRRVRLVSAAIEREIRQTLLDFSISGELRRSRRSIRTQVRRIANPTQLLQSTTLLLLLPVVQVGFGIAVGLAIAYSGSVLTAVEVMLIWALMGLWGRVRFARPSGIRSKWFVQLASLWEPSGVSLTRNSLEDADVSQRKFGGSRSTVASSAIIFVLMMFPLVATVGFYGEYDIGARSGIIVGAAVGSLWTIGALLAVREGRWLSTGSRLALSGLPIALGIEYFTAEGLRKTVKRIGKSLPGLILALVFVGGALSGIYFLVSKFPEAVIGSLGFLWLCGIAFALRSVGRRMWAARHDRRRLDRQSLDELSVVDVGWLLDELSRLRSSAGLIHFLRKFRLMKRRPVWHTEATSLLPELGRLAHDLRAARYLGSRAAVIRQEFTTRWQSAGLREEFRFEILKSAEVMDELARLDDTLTRAHSA
jgi:hypothetical protein